MLNPHSFYILEYEQVLSEGHLVDKPDLKLKTIFSPVLEILLGSVLPPYVTLSGCPGVRMSVTIIFTR
jgi:hypothetical protein